MNKIVKLLHRNILLSNNLYRISKQRLKLKQDSDPSKKSKALDVKAEKNHATWVKQIADENLLKGKVCIDDVYFTNEYEQFKYPITVAIINHQEHCLDKSMLDSPKSVLNANFVFNMKTKKVSKYVLKLQGIIVPPHPLDFIGQRKILAFCKSSDDVATALASGAFDAGDEVLVKKIEQGQIHYEEFDQAVCHVDALPLISKLRPILKEKMPMKGTARVADDVKTLVDKYVHGYEFDSRKVEGVPEEAHLTVPLGQIDWPAHQLEANFSAFLDEILANCSPQVAGDPVTKVTLKCPPSDETFEVDISERLTQMQKTRTTRRPPAKTAVDEEI